ncbi:MAG: S1/P1 nuclease [Tatlockia sp.]|nr:S1/P1 nuclease [Tatlockia sp.]
MINKALLSLLILALLPSTPGYGWSSLGHRLVAQIAYDHLTKEAKRRCNHYNHALDKLYRPQNLINSAAWLDSLRGPKDRELEKKHYINFPFSFDGTKLIPPNKINAVSAIKEAEADLNSDSDDFHKGFSLRILIHVVADLHQPLHAASQYSVAHPEGDKGGNLFILAKNPLATNLHQYWDKGGGFLTAKPYSNKQLKRRALIIEKKWPCQTANMNLNPRVWANESHRLAVEKAYLIQARQKPSKKYQYMVKRITERRLALAGCRLAAILNKIP